MTIAKNRSRNNGDDESSGSAVMWSVLGGAALVLILGVGIFFMTRAGSSRTPAAKAPPGQLPAPIPIAKQKDPRSDKDKAADAEPHKAVDEADNDKAFAALFPKKNASPKEPDKIAGPGESNPGPAMKDAVEAPKPGKQEVRDVPGVTPKKINDAIRKGINYLAKTEKAWFDAPPHRLGYIALGGLTMIECKVDHNDPTLQRAANLTRQMAPAAEETYEIAVAILFLDRLGEKKDIALVQMLGARLIAGQQSGGGFGYKCPILTAAETNDLLAFAARTRPRTGPAAMPGVEGEFPTSTMTTPEGIISPQPPKIRPKDRLSGNTGTVRLDKGAVIPLTSLSPRLKSIPLVINQGRNRDQMILTFPEALPTDQSNLQFAVLGMWVARRHGVATDRALLLADARLRQLQQPDGQFEYSKIYQQSGTTITSQPIFSDSMACAGLLTLAVGHAIYQPDAPTLARSVAADPKIELAMQPLRKLIGNPAPSLDGVNGVPTFLLWSVERAAVLFNLQTIDGKDWYGWGAQSLLKFQNEDGSWNQGGYTGATPHVDTCFALLFLQRSNLVRDLSEYIVIQRPNVKK
jgi:hypothetical protein